MTVSQDVSRSGGYANKFAAGSASGIETDIELAHITLIGSAKSGKSYLTANNPRAFVFNFDKTAFDPGTRAGVWPIRDTDGTFKEAGPRGLVQIKSPTFDDYLKVKDELIAMAARNDPNRPKTIVIDTITAMCNYVQEWLVVQKGKSSFKDLGQDGWFARNCVIEKFSRDLYSAGYGVINLLHFSPRYIPVWDEKSGQTINKHEVLPTVSDGLWRMITVAPSLIGVVGRKKVNVSKTGVPKYEEKYVLEVARDNLGTGATGSRFKMPAQIELSTEHPWDSVVEAVRTASAS